MTDVPLTLAVISTVSPVAAGALPLIFGWLRDSGHDKRERAERLAVEQLRLSQEKRGQCVKLVRLARDFRVLVENAHDSLGSELADYAKQVRQFVVDLTGQADEVGFMLPAAESAATSLAVEADVLGATVADSKNRQLGAPLLSPDYKKFDRCLTEFKEAARAALGDPAAIPAKPRSTGQLRQAVSGLISARGVS